jgi:PAS domain S-box-containing protein
MQSISITAAPRLLLVDASNDVRERLRALIDEDRRCVVVGEAADLAQARRLFGQTQPDAVVLDLHLGEATTFDLMAEFERSRPTCCIVVLTHRTERVYRERCLELGADHFLDKGSDFERIAPLLAEWHAATSAGSALRGDPAEGTAADQADGKQDEAERLLDRVLDASGSSLWDLDLRTGRVSLSRNWSAMLGGPRMAITTEFNELAERVPEADRRRIAEAMRPALSGEVDDYAVEHAVLNPAGEPIWILSEGRVVERAADGRALRAVGTNRDISAQVRARLALRASEAQLRRLIDNLAAGVLVYGADGSIVLSNVHAQQLLGLPLRRTAERTMADPQLDFIDEGGHLLGPADHPWRQVLASGVPLRNRVLGIRRAGGDDTVWTIVNAFPEFGAGSRVEQVVLSLVDITDRREAELALRRSEGRLRALVELSSDWLWEQDASLRFTLVTDNGQDHAGLSAAEHLGKTRWELPHLDTGEADWAAHREQLARREVFRDFEIKRRDPQGQLRTVLVSGMPVFDDVGSFAGYRGISRDVTSQRVADSALRALETQLLESQRMESIGTLASGIAHDFNGIVAAISANVTMARDALVPGSAAQAPLARIETASRRARALVHQILAFARREPQVLVSQPLQPVVQETLALFRSCLPESASLIDQTSAAVPIYVMADATQIQQVLMNLCTNALHALDNRIGRIDVGIDTTVLVEDTARPIGLDPGHYARIWVSDNGRGMDAAVLSRIFEPLFTTKPAGQGTGLGLSVVMRIMTGHGGTVIVHSQPGSGSTFELFLPLADPDSGLAPLAIDTVPGAWRSQGHVLVVDDDEVLQLTVVGLLEREGLRVSACANANDALAAVRNQPADFDLVVADFNMSVMSGLDMARNLSLIRGDLPVLIISGLVTDELRVQASEVDVRSVLDKGALGGELVQAVHQALRRAHAGRD